MLSLIARRTRVRRRSTCFMGIDIDVAIALGIAIGCSTDLL